MYVTLCMGGSKKLYISVELHSKCTTNTLSHLGSMEPMRLHSSCTPHPPGLQLAKCKPVYSLGKRCIKRAQHFDLKLKSLIMIDHNYRFL